MSGRNCDICGVTLAGYFPGAMRCDACTDCHGFEFETGVPEIETETLADCLQDIAGGLQTDSLGFWIASPPC